MPLKMFESICCASSYGKIVEQTRFFSLILAKSKEKENSEFKPVLPRLKIDLVPLPTRGGGVRLIYTLQSAIYMMWLNNRHFYWAVIRSAKYFYVFIFVNIICKMWSWIWLSFSAEFWKTKLFLMFYREFLNALCTLSRFLQLVPGDAVFNQQNLIDGQGPSCCSMSPNTGTNTCCWWVVWCSRHEPNVVGCRVKKCKYR